MKRNASQSAFTMLELVLVLMVVAIALAIVAPKLTGWGRGARLRDAGDEFLAATRWAHGQAVATAIVHRVEIDPSEGTFRVTKQDGETFVDVTGEFSEVTTLPLGVRIELDREDGNRGDVIEFQPNGRVTPATVRFSNDRGESLEVEAPTPAEPFRLAAQVSP
jgi:type II secretion system protein H